jgi:glycine oxidase
VFIDYNAEVKTWDVIVAGGGIIGLSLARELRKRDARVLVVERGEPGHEASSAAAGMLVDAEEETLPALRELARASARMYPEFAHILLDESGIDVDLRDQGTMVFARSGESYAGPDAERLSASDVARLEPALAEVGLPAFYLKERSVDPRALVRAALQAAKHRGVDFVTGTTVTELLLSDARVAGVRTERSSYGAPVVVNCAGAWAGQILSHHFPTRPVKGQMLAVVGGPKLRHVVRSPDVYLVRRTDGRILIGSTVEEAGYDKRTDVDTIHRLYQAAIRLVPALAEARILEDWAGLRPGTPDNLPILGATSTPGYFVAAGHFRDGILLTPVTAYLIAQVIAGARPDYDISAFSPARFQVPCGADTLVRGA